MSTIQNRIKTLAEYVERSTHWEEGGATRHDAKLALKELPDEVEWIEKGLAEWRSVALAAQQQARQATAQAKLALDHLDKILNGCRTADEQQAADTAGRDFLQACGR